MGLVWELEWEQVLVGLMGFERAIELAGEKAVVYVLALEPSTVQELVPGLVTLWAGK